MPETITIQTKIQAIYCMTPENDLRIIHATHDKRLSLVEAAEILKEQGIVYNDLLRVKYETATLTIPTQHYYTYLEK